MSDGRDEKSIEVRRRRYGDAEALEVTWDFGVRGGTYGVVEADAFDAICAEAVATSTPLVTRLRSGGTRLQEGMRALVGIPRAALALERLAGAHLPHVAVAEHPTTGGVWVAVGSIADLRAAVAGATVGFSGPRVVEAMYGVPLPPGANTAERASAAGIVDALVTGDTVDDWVAAVLAALAPDDAEPAATQADAAVPDRTGWAQVVHSREVARPSGRALLATLLDRPVALRGADESVAAAVGRIAGRRAVMVAVAAERAGQVTPAGYALLVRAAALADRLDCALVTLVDTVGADPMPASEESGLAAAIAAAMTAVLRCAGPTIAVVHGEGGSGGALAAATCDVVGVTADGWFAALGPEGAGAALRSDAAEAAEVMRVAPAQLLEDGFADALAPSGAELRGWLAAVVGQLRAEGEPERLERRRARWSSPLGGPRPRLFG